VTDLPRFYDGAVGRLDFTTLNEMMRRLDRLLPLVESASLQGGDARSVASLTFPAYATELDGEPGRFYWEELVYRADDTLLTKTDEDYDEVVASGVRQRSGGVPDPKTGEMPDDYGVLLDPASTFTRGFVTCMPVRRIDGVVRYVLAPISIPATGVAPSSFVFRTEAPQGVQQWNIGGTVMEAMTYSGTLLQVDGEDVDEEPNILLFDWSYHRINQPLSSTSDVSTSYHEHAPGTMLSVSAPQDEAVHFGAPCRLDFECV
jgi:hypothetical protein